MLVAAAPRPAYGFVLSRAVAAAVEDFCAGLGGAATLREDDRALTVTLTEAADIAAFRGVFAPHIVCEILPPSRPGFAPRYRRGTAAAPLPSRNAEAALARIAAAPHADPLPIWSIVRRGGDAGRRYASSGSSEATSRSS